MDCFGTYFNACLDLFFLHTVQEPWTAPELQIDDKTVPEIKASIFIFSVFPAETQSHNRFNVVSVLSSHGVGNPEDSSKIIQGKHSCTFFENPRNFCVCLDKGSAFCVLAAQHGQTHVSFFAQQKISRLELLCELQVVESPEVRNMLCPILDLSSDDESTHGMQSEAQVHNDDAELNSDGSQIQPVSCDHAAEEEESESLSPPHVEGPYFEAGFLDSPPSKRRKIDHLIRHSELLDWYLLFGLFFCS